jgi:transcriptional regulator with XRE-family HTH domain
LTSEHIRAARALLRWEQSELANRSGVWKPTIARLEAKPGPLAAHGPTIAALKSALEKAGVEFLNHGRPGVRLIESRHELRVSGFVSPPIVLDPDETGECCGWGSRNRWAAVAHCGASLFS